ncbi:hypothetical protein I6F26_14475 [Ensifer sp. IC3342]|nr:hypothetical protein [Ensifer sp. BRP08]MCA1447784.1 hypothetical protein [Ensifer sp. IC3342]
MGDGKEPRSKRILVDLSVLHDDLQIVPVSDQRDVRQRVAADDQEIGERIRFDDAELADIGAARPGEGQQLRGNPASPSPWAEEILPRRGLGPRPSSL